MRDDIEIEVFSRPDCHLCDIALEIIANLQQRYPLMLKVTNVETDPQLEEKYGSQVPVVCIGRHTMFKYPFKPAELESEMNRLWNP